MQDCLRCFVTEPPRIEIECVGIQIRNFLRLGMGWGGMVSGDGGM
jgi:hypothetical protein